MASSINRHRVPRLREGDKVLIRRVDTWVAGQVLSCANGLVWVKWGSRSRWSWSSQNSTLPGLAWTSAVPCDASYIRRDYGSLPMSAEQCRAAARRRSRLQKAAIAEAEARAEQQHFMKHNGGPQNDYSYSSSRSRYSSHNHYSSYGSYGSFSGNDPKKDRCLFAIYKGKHYTADEIEAKFKRSTKKPIIHRDPMQEKIEAMREHLFAYHFHGPEDEKDPEAFYEEAFSVSDFSDTDDRWAVEDEVAEGWNESAETGRASSSAQRGQSVGTASAARQQRRPRMDRRRDPPEEASWHEETAPSADWVQAEVQQDSHEPPQREDDATPPPSAVKQDWSNPYDLSSFGGGTVSYSASYSLDTLGSSTPAHSASSWPFDDHRPTSASYGIPDDGNQKKDARYSFSDDAPSTHHSYGMPEMSVNHTSSFSYSFDDDSSRSTYSYNISLNDSNDSNASQGYSIYDSSDRYDNDRTAYSADKDNDTDTDTDQSNDEAVDGGEGIGLLFSAKQATREDSAPRPSINASNASKKAKPAPASNGKQQARVVIVQANKAPGDREAKKRLKYEARLAKREEFKRRQQELKRVANLPAKGPYADECDSW